MDHGILTVLDDFHHEDGDLYQAHCIDKPRNLSCEETFLLLLPLLSFRLGQELGILRFW